MFDTREQWEFAIGLISAAPSLSHVVLGIRTTGGQKKEDAPPPSLFPDRIPWEKLNFTLCSLDYLEMVQFRIEDGGSSHRGSQALVNSHPLHQEWLSSFTQGLPGVMSKGLLDFA